MSIAKYEKGRKVSVYLGWGQSTMGEIKEIRTQDGWPGNSYGVVYDRGGYHFIKWIMESEIYPFYTEAELAEKLAAGK